MLTVRATLEPNGHVELPRTLVQNRPVPVLLTFLEPLPDATALPTGEPAVDNAAATLALLRSPAFLALPRADAAEVGQRIKNLRDDWNED